MLLATNLELFWIRWQTDNHTFQGAYAKAKIRGRMGKCGMNDESFDVVCQHGVLSCVFFIQRFFHVQSLPFDLNTLFSVG